VNLRDLIPSVKAQMLSWLPVPIARKYFQMSARRNLMQGIPARERQLLVDVSVILNKDARTGIQRVVRALLLQLLQHPPAGCRVRPVFATRKHGYRYAHDRFGLLEVHVPDVAQSAAVSVRQNDIFLGLDLAAHLLPLHRAELAHWKRSGAEIHIIVYDLLPVLHPQWFNRKTTRNFHRWLRTIAVFADSAMCISHTVKTDLTDWMHRQYGIAAGTLPINTIPLGADIQSSAPSRGLPENVDQILGTLSETPTVLMVGTLEPRKGHSQVLAAFENLWQQGHETNLVIVGKPGWQTDTLQQALRTHPHIQTRLHWLDDASDELLELLYAASAGVIVASEAEGFGLPLIEAMHHNKPVLARDIPVLREIGGDSVSFFTNAETLTQELETWLVKITTEQSPHNAPQQTWQDSANALLIRLALGQTIFTRTDTTVFPSTTQEAMV
jgi:glycosyltransferase involved in cell wall biosynthesis